MKLRARLDRLEGSTANDAITQLWLAYEETPGRYRLDDGRVLNEAELAALPGSGPGLHGLIITLPEGKG